MASDGYVGLLSGFAMCMRLYGRDRDRQGSNPVSRPSGTCSN